MGLVAPWHMGPSQIRHPALASGFFTTEPPGKPWLSILNTAVCTCPSPTPYLLLSPSPRHTFATISSFSKSVSLFLCCCLVLSLLKQVLLINLFIYLLAASCGTWDIAPRSEIECTPPALEAVVLTNGTPGKSSFHGF